jgi:hypothetical protein
MASDERPRKALKWLLVITGAVLVFVVTGLLAGWQLATGIVFICFAVGWAAEFGQKKGREAEAYREEWLHKRKSEGAGPEDQGFGPPGPQ